VIHPPLATLHQPMNVHALCMCEHALLWHTVNGRCQFPTCRCVKFEEKALRPITAKVARPERP